MENTIYIYSDGGSRGNPGPAACAFVVYQNDKKIYEASKYLGVSTNNIAEYEGVLMGLSWLYSNSKKYQENIVFRMDSELVTRQIQGTYKVKSDHLIPLFQKAKELIEKIDKRIIFESVPRGKNKEADALLNSELDKNKNTMPSIC